MLTKLRALALATAAAIGAASPALAEDTIRIRLQTAYPPRLPLIGETAVLAVDKIKLLSGGSVDIRLYEPDKLVPTLEILDAVSTGNLDAGFTAPAFSVGKNSALALFTAMPFGPEGPEYMSWVYHGGGLEIWRDIYAKFNVVTVPCGIIPPEGGGWFKKEINSPADLQGLKLRWAGLGGEVVQKLGASTTLTGVADIIPSLDRGLIDGAEVGNPSVDRVVGMHKAATKYLYFPGWHQQAAVTEMIFNKNVWAKMSERQKAVVDAACQQMAVYALSKGYGEQADALAFFKEQGINVRSWSPEMLKLFREKTTEVLDQASAANPDFKRAYESLKAFRTKYQPWASVAFIRDDR